MVRQLALMAFLICLSSAAGAQPVAEDLPDATNYPEPQCKKPQVNMVKPDVQVGGRGNAIDSGALGSYNSRVKAFNRDAGAYNSCMHAYIDKANGDVKVIQDKANADLKQITERANASMKAIQDKIRQAVAEANSVTAAMDEQTAKLRSK